MTGCETIKTVTVTEKVGTVPPASTYQVTEIPVVPAGLPESERQSALLQSYSARKMALEQCNAKANSVAAWVDEILRLYPETEVQAFHGERE